MEKESGISSNDFTIIEHLYEFQNATTRNKSILMGLLCLFEYRSRNGYLLKPSNERFRKLQDSFHTTITRWIENCSFFSADMAVTKIFQVAQTYQQQQIVGVTRYHLLAFENSNVQKIHESKSFKSKSRSKNCEKTHFLIQNIQASSFVG